MMWKRKDGFYFVPCLDFGEDKDDLKEECGKKEEVIPRDPKSGSCAKGKEGRKRSGKNTRPRLFNAEKDEFPNECAIGDPVHIRREGCGIPLQQLQSHYLFSREILYRYSSKRLGNLATSDILFGGVVDKLLEFHSILYPSFQCADYLHRHISSLRRFLYPDAKFRQRRIRFVNTATSDEFSGNFIRRY